MALIDHRGRLFGKINLIDLALIVFVAVLLPLGYGAYVLFRTPPPRIIAVTPNPLTFKKGEQRVHVTGEDMQPFMRATLGKTDARAFLIERRDSAEVVFDELPPGTYDLALFDTSQEVARLPNALTIVLPPSPPVQIVGRFVGANAASASLAPGSRLGDRGGTSVEIIAAGPAVKGERLATLRASCDISVKPCVVAGTPVEIGKPILLRMPKADDAFSFVVDGTRADAVWAELHVRLFGLAEVLDLVKNGDEDRHLEPETPNAAAITRGAVVVSLEKPQPTQGVFSLNFSQALPDPGVFPASTLGSGYLPLQTCLAVLRVPLEGSATAWRYREAIIRAGSALTLETRQYFLRALILRVVTPNAAPHDRTDP